MRTIYKEWFWFLLILHFPYFVLLYGAVVHGPHRSLKNSVQIYTHIPGMRHTLIKSLCWLAEEKFFYLLFENWMVLICKTLILIHLRMFYASIRLKLALWLWRSLFLNFVNVFSLFRNFLPWKSAWLFNWTILNPLQPRMLFTSLVEIGSVVLQMFKKMKMWKLYIQTADDRRSEKLNASLGKGIQLFKLRATPLPSGDN